MHFNEDSEFLLRVAILFKGAYLPTPTAIVRNHAGNKSSDSSRQLEIIDAQIKSLKDAYHDYPNFGAQLGGDNFLVRIQGLAKKKADVYFDSGQEESLKSVLNEWNLLDYHRSRLRKIIEFKKTIINGSQVGWRLFTILTREL